MPYGADRTWEDVPQVEEMAKQNINQAVLYLLNMEIQDRVQKQKLIHIDSILARNEILQKEYMQ